MKSWIDNVLSSIIALILSTVVGIVLQAFGLSTQLSIALALFALVILFLIIGKFIPLFVRRLTSWLVKVALSIDLIDKDQAKVNFKKKIIGLVSLESSQLIHTQGNWIIEYANQASCEDKIVNAFRDARKVKILTIRGEKYFLGHRSLFHDLSLLKRGSGFSIKVLVLSSDAGHISDELAHQLGQSSSREIKLKMQMVFDYLRTMTIANKNFEVKYYNETPIFKILLFDEVMFVSAFIQEKSDYNVKMLQVTKEGNPLFISFEKYFDDLWLRAQH